MTEGDSSSSSTNCNPAVSSSSRASSSAIRPDGTLNVDLLSHEIARDLSDDARYKAEDSMKKRAVHGSRDYDEFRSFVACSQLKPVKGSELSQLINPGSSSSARSYRGGGGVSERTGGGGGAASRCVAEDFLMNSSSSSKGGGREGKKKDRNRRAGQPGFTDGGEVGFPSAAPRTSSEFHRQWRVQCRGREDREMYVTEVLTPSTFEGLFSRIALDPTLMGEILETLEALVVRRRVQGENAETGRTFPEVTVAFEWMRAITRCDRFSLNVAFLESKHTNAVRTILNCIESECNQSEDEIQINSEQLQHLRQMYHVAR